VGMGIVEAGEYELPCRVDLLRICAGEFLDVLGRANCNDAIPINRHRLGGRSIAIHRVNFCIEDDQVGNERGLVGMRCEIG